MTTLVLLRHGQSEWNRDNKFTGFFDAQLTEQGIAEAIKAGEKLKAAGIVCDHAFTSTLSRASRTARLTLENAGQSDLITTMTAHDDLRERDYGDLVGLNKGETKDKYGADQVHIWRRSYDTRPPGGECLKDVVENRVGPYYKRAIQPLTGKGKTLLIAAHGNSLRALLIVLGAETPDTINDAEFPTGTPLVLTLDETSAVTSRKFL